LLEANLLHGLAPYITLPMNRKHPYCKSFGVDLLAKGTIGKQKELLLRREKWFGLQRTEKIRVVERAKSSECGGVPEANLYIA